MKAAVIRNAFVLSLFIAGIVFAQGLTNGIGRVSDEPATVKIAGDRAEITMELVSRKPVVDVRINGKGPFRFFLDTGAGVTVFDQSLAKELSLEQDGTTRVGDPANPEGITANRNIVKTLKVGGAVFSDLTVVSWDRSGLYTAGAPRGVLGMPLFRNVVLTVDYPGSRIVIEKGSLAKGVNVIDYRLNEAGLFSVPLTVAGKDMFATLDTGAMSGLSFPPSHMGSLPLEAKPREVGRGRMVGGEATIYGAKLKGAVGFGGAVFESPDVTFFERLRDLNIGYGLLGQFAITIDQQNRRMRFVKGTPVAAVKPAAPPQSADQSSSEYRGTYGERRITFDNGNLFLQRVAGPQGAGPVIKLSEVTKDAYSLEGMSGPRIKFVRSADGKVIAMQVLGPDGNWQSAKKQT